MTERSTDALIEALAADVAPVPRAAVSARIALALLGGGTLTLVLVLAVLGPRPDLMSAMRGQAIWMKWGYTLALAAVSIAVTQQLARPERRGARWLWLAAIPVVLIAALALRELAGAPASTWTVLWLGHSWRVCPLRVLALSLPIFAGLCWAFRRLAPTRLRLAGAAAGFAAGTVAATLYGFACDETSALFLATWYSLGIAGAAAVGALLGPRLLRW